MQAKRSIHRRSNENEGEQSNAHTRTHTRLTVIQRNTPRPSRHVQQSLAKEGQKEQAKRFGDESSRSNFSRDFRKESGQSSVSTDDCIRIIDSISTIVYTFCQETITGFKRAAYHHHHHRFPISYLLPTEQNLLPLSLSLSLLDLFGVYVHTTL